MKLIFQFTESGVIVAIGEFVFVKIIIRLSEAYKEGFRSQLLLVVVNPKLFQLFIESLLLLKTVLADLTGVGF